MFESCFWDYSKRASFYESIANQSPEERLEAYESQLFELNEYAIQHRELISAVKQHKVLWGKWRILELDLLNDNPDRITNRGGFLLREEKERKTTLRKLNQLKLQIFSLAKEDSKFLIHGQTVAMWFKALQESLEVEKATKAEAKVSLLNVN